MMTGEYFSAHFTNHAPIAYTYEADHHCPACAAKRFGDALDDPDTEDSEGNPLGVVSPWDEWWDVSDSAPVVETLACGDCRAILAAVTSPRGIEAAAHAYVTCALWSSTDDDGAPLDDWATEDDVDPDALAEMRDDVAAFIESEKEDLAGMDAEQIGHDFWLTRNGHGAGFWDRGLGERGDRLTAACKPYGAVDLYVGEDGKVYAQ